MDPSCERPEIDTMRRETECALRAAVAAKRIASARLGADQVTSKGGIDVVTGSDLACEDAIRFELEESFPDISIVGEERGGEPRDSQPYWLVDPICGTRAFASNIPLYCTNIALVEQGEVVCSVVGVGGTDEFLYAECGAGAWSWQAGTSKPIGPTDLSDTVWIDGRTDVAAEIVRAILLQRRWYVMQFASSVAYAFVACGKISAALQFPSKSPVPPYGSVHSAAGCFLAQEAGAIVSDLETGEPWRLASASYLIAANDDLANELRRIVSGVRSIG